MNHTNLVSGYDPETDICWQFRNKGDRARPRCRCPACSVDATNYTLTWFGRCRSGARWFWIAQACDSEKESFGWSESDTEAMAAAMTAVRGFHDGLPIRAHLWQDCAYGKLKQLNKQKRAARPASSSRESRPDEYLYSRWGDQFRIIKKTKQRFYYNKCPLKESPFAYLDYNDDAIGFIPRNRVKADCDFEESSYHTLYLNKPQRPAWEQELPDLNKLKRAMAAAHPDRGGSSAAFIAARKEYLTALQTQKARR